jgi:hypothetical protein
MNRFTRTTSLALGVALAWGVLMALAWKPYLDPLIGFGLRGYIGYVGFHVVLAGMISLAFCRRWRLLGSLLVALALFLALPLPSKRGVDVRVVNATTAPAQVIVTRMDSTARHITLSLPHGQTVSYRSAPGDYSESIQFAIEHGTLRLPVTVADLRQHQVCLTDTEILLADIRKD